MKVVPTTLPTGAAPAQAPQPAAEGFRGLLDALRAGATGTPTGVGSAAPAASAAGVSSIASLLALQGGGAADARALALRKGRRMMDALDRLQVALLSEGPSLAHLQALKGALAEDRPHTDDRELDDALGWVEVRVAVEAAKLAR